MRFQPSDGVVEKRSISRFIWHHSQVNSLHIRQVMPPTFMGRSNPPFGLVFFFHFWFSCRHGIGSSAHDFSVHFVAWPPWFKDILDRKIPIFCFVFGDLVKTKQTTKECTTEKHEYILEENQKYLFTSMVHSMKFESALHTNMLLFFFCTLWSWLHRKFLECPFISLFLLFLHHNFMSKSMKNKKSKQIQFNFLFISLPLPLCAHLFTKRRKSFLQCLFFCGWSCSWNHLTVKQTTWARQPWSFVPCMNTLIMHACFFEQHIFGKSCSKLDC